LAFSTTLATNPGKTAANSVQRQLREIAFCELRQIIGDAPGLSLKNFKTSLMQAGQGPLANLADHDSVNNFSCESVEGLASTTTTATVVAGLFFDLTRFCINQQKHRGQTKVLKNLTSQTIIALYGETDCHWFSPY
jgi:hypothetical protein